MGTDPRDGVPSGGWHDVGRDRPGRPGTRRRRGPAAGRYPSRPPGCRVGTAGSRSNAAPGATRDRPARPTSAPSTAAGSRCDPCWATGARRAPGTSAEPCGSPAPSGRPRPSWRLSARWSVPVGAEPARAGHAVPAGRRSLRGRRAGDWPADHRDRARRGPQRPASFRRARRSPAGTGRGEHHLRSCRNGGMVLAGQNQSTSAWWMHATGSRPVHTP